MLSILKKGLGGGGGLDFSSPCYCLGLSRPSISKLQLFQVEHPYLKGQEAETFKIWGCGGLEHLHRLQISISTLNTKNLRCSNIHPFLMLKMSRCHSLHWGCFEMRKHPIMISTISFPNKLTEPGVLCIQGCILIYNLQTLSTFNVETAKRRKG